MGGGGKLPTVPMHRLNQKCQIQWDCQTRIQTSRRKLPCELPETFTAGEYICIFRNDLKARGKDGGWKETAQR